MSAFEDLMHEVCSGDKGKKMKKSKRQLPSLPLSSLFSRRASDVTVQVFTVEAAEVDHHHDASSAYYAGEAPPTSANSDKNKTVNILNTPSSSPPMTYLSVPRLSLPVPQIIEPEACSSSESDHQSHATTSTISTSAPVTSSSSPKKNSASQAERKTGGVPQINLKRRESGYESDLALIASRRSHRSSSMCSSVSSSTTSSSSSSSSSSYSPLLPLSANELFPAGDEDGLSSISSSMTSLSALSIGADESQYSNDSGRGGDPSLQGRRCVSFSDVNAASSPFEKKTEQLRWENNHNHNHHHNHNNHHNNTLSVAHASVHRGAGGRDCKLSSHSFSGHGDVKHHYRTARSHSEVGPQGHLRPNDHHSRRGGCLDPLRSSRCRSASCASLYAAMADESDPEETLAAGAGEGPQFTAKLYNRIGGRSDGSDALRNATHVHHVYKGTLLVTDMIDGRITFLGHNGRAVKQFQAETGSEPWCACVTPKGHVAVTLRRQSCVTVWSGRGTLVREFGHGVMQCPTGLACDCMGRFVVTDERANRVAIFSEAGKFSRFLGRKTLGQGSASGQQRSAKHVSNETPVNPTAANQADSDSSAQLRSEQDSKSKKAHSNDSTTNRANAITSNTATATKLTVNANNKHISNTDESLKIADKDDANADPTDACSSDASLYEPFEFSLPRYACITSSGKIVVSDSGSHSVKVFTSGGDFLRSIGGHGSGDGQLKVPYGVCCDQQENIYVADHYNDRVSVFSIDGQFLQHALTATASSGLSRPKSVAVRGSAHERKLYIAHGGLRSTEVLVLKLHSGRRHSVSFSCDV